MKMVKSTGLALLLLATSAPMALAQEENNPADKPAPEMGAVINYNPSVRQSVRNNPGPAAPTVQTVQSDGGRRGDGDGRRGGGDRWGQGQGQGQPAATQPAVTQPQGDRGGRRGGGGEWQGRGGGEWQGRGGGQRGGGDWQGRRGGGQVTTPTAPQVQAPVVQQPQGGQTWQGRGDRRGGNNNGQQWQGRGGQGGGQAGQQWQGQGDRRGDDRRGDGRRGDGRDWDRNNNSGQSWNNGANNRWNGQRPRYDRRHYPSAWRTQQRYRIGRYLPPSGFYFRSWTYGDVLPRGWYGMQYQIHDWWSYGLPVPPIGCEWIRVGDDALLIDQFTGRVLMVAYGLFW